MQITLIEAAQISSSLAQQHLFLVVHGAAFRLYDKLHLVKFFKKKQAIVSDPVAFSKLSDSQIFLFSVLVSFSMPVL